MSHWNSAEKLHKNGKWFNVVELTVDLCTRISLFILFWVIFVWFNLLIDDVIALKWRRTSSVLIIDKQNLSWAVLDIPFASHFQTQKRSRRELKATDWYCTRFN